MRPHPTDDIRYVKKLMARHGVKSELIHCVDKNDAFPWISAASVLIHNCCTTSLEAAFCGTPVVTFAPSQTSLLLEDQINNLFPVANSYSEVINELDEYMDTGKIPTNFKTLIDNWGRLSLKYSGSTSNFIADRITKKYFQNELFLKKQFLRHTDFKRLKYEIIAYLAKSIGIHERQVLLNKFPKTSLYEVKNIVSKICKFREYEDQPKVTYINSHLFGFS